jgi:hypothetical protein
MILTYLRQRIRRPRCASTVSVLPLVTEDRQVLVKNIQKGDYYV